ncbi:MAG: aminoacyl-tRNA hydrolase [Propionibacteriaceae bacterium]|nr:aminoacyl-tRNA hydrolase [Propionibacteriaceae bacterium]
MNLWLVVGLGNPGPTYALTRHNVGFWAVEELAARAGTGFAAASRMRALATHVSIPAAPGRDAIKLLLAKPTTFMNESGIAVGALASFYKIAPERVVVVHDELDLDPGRLRLKFGGGDNGHNGLKSVRKHLATGDFYRVRIGIGRPPGRQDPAAWVLAKMSPSDTEDLKVDSCRAADAVLELVQSGLETAQNKYNT